MSTDIIIEHGDSPPQAAIIWLHGLGADGNDFVPIIPQLALPPDMAVRFVFPNAPVIPITVNQGYRMPGWYDITTMEVVDRNEDNAGIRQSSDRIAELLRAQMADGIASERIILAGFSQGGVIALHCALGFEQPLAGIMALSSYLPDCADTGSRAQLATPIFMAHGAMDEVIALKYAKMSLNELKSSGFDVNWHEYNMGHSVCEAEIRDIAKWLQQRLLTH